MPEINPKSKKNGSKTVNTETFTENHTGRRESTLINVNIPNCKEFEDLKNSLNAENCQLFVDSILKVEISKEIIDQYTADHECNPERVEYKLKGPKKIFNYFNKNKSSINQNELAKLLTLAVVHHKHSQNQNNGTDGDLSSPDSESHQLVSKTSIGDIHMIFGIINIIIFLTILIIYSVLIYKINSSITNISSDVENLNNKLDGAQKITGDNEKYAAQVNEILKKVNHLSENKVKSLPSDDNKINQKVSELIGDDKNGLVKQIADLDAKVGAKPDLDAIKNSIVTVITNEFQKKTNNPTISDANNSDKKFEKDSSKINNSLKINQDEIKAIASQTKDLFLNEIKNKNSQLWKLFSDQNPKPELISKTDLDNALKNLLNQLPQKKAEENSASKFTGPKGYFAILLANSKDFPVDKVFLETITRIADKQIKKSNNEQKVGLYVASSEKLEEIYNPISKKDFTSKGLSITDPNSTEKLTDISKSFVELAFTENEKIKDFKITTDGRKAIIIANSASNAPDAGKAGEWDKVSKVDVILVQKTKTSTFYNSSEWLNFVAQKNGRIMIVQGDGSLAASSETMNRLGKSLEHLLDTQELK